MIHDTLDNFSRYIPLHPRFAAVAEFLRTHDLAALPEGRVEILPDGEIYANVQTTTGKAASEAPMEFHRKYIDIQVPLATPEQMGWLPLAKAPETLQYDDAKDAALGPATPTTYATVLPGEFTIFFPTDIHAPCIGAGAKMPKVIFKVRVE